MEGAELRAWRQTERQRLLALRTGVAPSQRRHWGEAIAARLISLLGERPVTTLGIYWPIQAEFDPRPMIDWLVAQGLAVALPAVVDKKGPLEYRAWRPGEPLVDGVWNIPTPQKRDIVIPHAVLAPLVGFDLEPRLWRRLFRPHISGPLAAAAGDRRGVRTVADQDDLPATLRYPDGCRRHGS